MTISTTTRLFIYQGNGATTVFPYDFLVPSTDVFSVQLQDHTTGTVLSVLNPSDYILTGVGNPAGGTVTYNPVGGPITSAVDIVGIRTMPFTQDTEISNQGGFYPEAIEQQLDFIVMQIQQLAEEQSRSLTVNPGQDPPDLQLLEDKVAEAESWANASQTSAINSANSATASSGSATSSANSATLAGQYANYPEDSQIPGHPGEFSALHFRNKCQAIFDALTNTLAGWIHAATPKATPADADELGIADSAASFGLKKITFTSLWQYVATKLGLRNGGGFLASFVTTALTAGRAITVPDRDVDLSNALKYGTNVTLSSTSVDFLNIPSGTKRITILIEALSLNGSASPLIQLGTSGGIQNTGYVATANSVANPNLVTGSTFTAGFGLNTGAAVNIHTGIIHLDLVNPSTNHWVATGNFVLEGVPTMVLLAGSKALAAALDRVRITSSNGTDTFDSGTVNIIYE